MLEQETEAEFVVDESEFHLAGVDLAILNMKVGEQAVVHCGKGWSYGDQVISPDCVDSSTPAWNIDDNGGDNGACVSGPEAACKFGHGRGRPWRHR